MNNIYAADKLAHFPDRVADLRAGKPIAPVQLLLSLSDLCNHDCKWCANRNSALLTAETFADQFGNHNPNRRMDLRKVYEIIDDCVDLGVKAVQLTGGGEPTLHPNFAEICDDLYHSRLEFGVITNGCKLDEKSLAKLARAAWVRVSVDAANAETHAKLHNVSTRNWPILWDNVKQLVALNGPTVGVSFIVQEANWRQIEQFVALALDAGAHNARLSPLIDERGHDYFKPFESQAVELCHSAMQLATYRFHVHDLFDERAATMQAPWQKRCYYQQIAPFVGADLNVYRCCNTSYSRHGFLGSIADKSFATLWRSLVDFASFDGTTCRFCVFKDKNATIERLVAEPSRHDYFV
jgi:MoaA/NifB/PqqE/SkfB family radical SAM enzyme